MNEQRRMITCGKQGNATPIDREARLEAERIYRTSFMRIILAGLTKLRWPPALEAFSDPLDSLLHDRAVILSAFSYILKFGTPVQRMRESLPTQQSQASPPPEREINIEESDVSSNHNMNMSFLSAGSESSFSSRSIGIDSPRRGNSEFDTSDNQFPRTVFEKRGESRSINGSSSSQSKSGSVRGGRGNEMLAITDRPKDYATLLQAFEVAQYQNEVLSKQLKRLQVCTCSRNIAQIICKFSLPKTPTKYMYTCIYFSHNFHRHQYVQERPPS